MPGKNSNGNAVCSFCGKSKPQVNKLIQGPTANICDECVELCLEILDMDADENERSGAKLESLSELPKPKELHSYLNDYIIGQDEAKKALSVAIYLSLIHISLTAFIIVLHTEQQAIYIF